MLDVRPARFRHWTVPAFGVWNLVVWLTRARNLASDDTLSSASRAAWFVPVVVFCAGGVLCLVAYWKGREAYAMPIKAFALGASLYWLVRAVVVLFGEHNAGFKVVHALLALLTIVVAGQLLRVQRRVEMVPQGAFL